jgi:hypothetical protein
MHGRSTSSPYPGRNDEHIRMLGHCREGRIGIFEHELGEVCCCQVANIFC